jgi:hypothetical protein
MTTKRNAIGTRTGASSAAVITSRAAVQRVSETFRQLLTENIQLQRKLEEVTKGMKTISVSAGEMDLIKAAPRVSKAMREIVPLLERRIEQGSIARKEMAVLYDTLREAAGFVRLDEAVQRLRRDRVVLVVA